MPRNSSCNTTPCTPPASPLQVGQQTLVARPAGPDAGVMAGLHPSPSPFGALAGGDPGAHPVASWSLGLGGAHATHPYGGGGASVQSANSGHGRGPGLLFPPPAPGQPVFGDWTQAAPPIGVHTSQIVRRAHATTQSSSFKSTAHGVWHSINASLLSSRCVGHGLGRAALTKSVSIVLSERLGFDI